MPRICHIDESGDLAPLSSATPGAQPVLAVVGLIVPESKLAQMERDFLAVRKTSEFLKGRRGAPSPDDFPSEDKGKDMFRLPLRSRDAGWRGAALSTLGLALDLLERAEARVAGCVHVKPIDREFNGARKYVSSVLSIAANFHAVLEAGHPEQARGELLRAGRILCDRQQRRTETALHNIFAARALRPPEFGDSESSAGLQLADWICSGIVAPLAAAACFDRAQLPDSKHIHSGYLSLRAGKNSPWERLTRMQFPFADENGRRRPGILVHPEELRPRLLPSAQR